MAASLKHPGLGMCLENKETDNSVLLRNHVSPHFVCGHCSLLSPSFIVLLAVLSFSIPFSFLLPFFPHIPLPPVFLLYLRDSLCLSLSLSLSVCFCLSVSLSLSLCLSLPLHSLSISLFLSHSLSVSLSLSLSLSPGFIPSLFIFLPCLLLSIPPSLPSSSLPLFPFSLPLFWLLPLPSLSLLPSSAYSLTEPFLRLLLCFFSTLQASKVGLVFVKTARSQSLIKSRSRGWSYQTLVFSRP